jgi:hypothetical protein
MKVGFDYSNYYYNRKGKYYGGKKNKTARRYNYESYYPELSKKDKGTSSQDGGIADGDDLIQSGRGAGGEAVDRLSGGDTPSGGCDYILPSEYRPPSRTVNRPPNSRTADCRTASPPFKKNARARLSGRRKKSILICALIMAAFVCAYIMFSSVASDGLSSVNISEKRYYAVCLGVYDDEPAAEANAARVRGRGAAGFVARENNYKVLSSAYAVKKDAQSVVDRLKANGVDAALFAIIIPKCRIKNVAAKSKDAVVRLLETYGQLYDELYALSVALDEELVGDGAYGSLRAIADRLNGIIAELDQMSESDGGLYIIYIKAQYVSVLNMVEAINLAESYFEISVSIKYTYLKMLYEFIDLYLELND